MAKSPTKNEYAWVDLFNELKILESIEKNGSFEISSRQINRVRQARLMAKFDQSHLLPSIMKNNGLSILPVTRGKYIISCFKNYQKLLFEDQIAGKDIDKTFSIPSHIHCIDSGTITGEASAINCAYISGMLSDFIDEDPSALFPVINGKMSSGIFDFCITNQKTREEMKISVRNSQVEIDGGYEGLNSLAIIEAKNLIPGDFLIRQMYYPFRLCAPKCVGKQIKNIFLIYTNGIFAFYEYRFSTPENYNSLQLVKQKKYCLNPDIQWPDIKELLNCSEIVSEPNIPFPQADSFERVINICENLLNRKFLSKNEIADMFAFTDRQADYYCNAGKYLGIIEQQQNQNIVLSKTGTQLLNLNLRDRLLFLAKLILRHKVFNDALRLYFEKSELPSKDEIVCLMKNVHLNKVGGDSTYYRRASTILSWLNWITRMID